MQSVIQTVLVDPAHQSGSNVPQAMGAEAHKTDPAILANQLRMARY